MFCYGGWPDPLGMQLSDQRELAERRMLQLLEDSGLPLPDEIQHGEYSVEFLWHDRKVAVVIDLDDFEEDEAMGAHTREGITA